MVYLQNEAMRVTIAELGAEIQAITAADDTEYLWDGNPAWWSGRAPVLFPICGRLRDGVYRYNGDTYSLPAHGFAKRMPFVVESATNTEAVFLLRDNEETRKGYPFAFEFRIRYMLDGATLRVEYDIHNPMTDTVLPASVGSHEAYACPEGLSAYDVVFEKEEPLDSYVVGDGGIEHNTYSVKAPDGILPLRDEFFAIDALVFRQLQSKAVTVRNRQTGRGVTVNFDGAETLLIWSKPGAPYVCVEPWCGFPDWDDFVGTFLDKEGMRQIPPQQTFSVAHTITLL